VSEKFVDVMLLHDIYAAIAWTEECGQLLVYFLSPFQSGGRMQETMIPSSINDKEFGLRCKSQNVEFRVPDAHFSCETPCAARLDERKQE
jgi:hypothetical protein